MDETKHSEFTGSEANINRDIKGKFEVFEGYCHGYNIELIAGKKIVQAWHFLEDGWPNDHFSICTFLFEPNGEGTKLTFTQGGVPDHKIEALTVGWNEFYWEPMQAYLEEN